MDFHPLASILNIIELTEHKIISLNEIEFPELTGYKSSLHWPTFLSQGCQYLVTIFKNALAPALSTAKGEECKANVTNMSQKCGKKP